MNSSSELKKKIQKTSDIINNPIVNVINNIFTPCGDITKDTHRALSYAKQVGMDKANTEIAVIMATQGLHSGARKMINICTDEKGNFD